MKKTILLFILIPISLISYSQCFEYSSEIQNIISSLSEVNKDLKKIEKSNTVEDSQYLIENAVEEITEAIRSCSLAESIADECGCNEGVTYSRIYNSMSSGIADALTKLKKEKDIANLKLQAKKVAEVTEVVKNEAMGAVSLCDE